MFKIIDGWLAELAVFVSPLFDLFEPLYVKIKPYLDKIAARFYKLLKKQLKISPEEKSKIALENVVRNFRFYSVLAVIFRILFSVIAAQGSLLIVWSTLIVNLPLVYLVCKGYRLAYLLLIFSNTTYSLLMLIADPKSILFVGVWWFIACTIYFLGFKYENGQVEMSRNGEIKPLFYHPRKDIVAIVLIIALTSMFAQLVSYVNTPRMPTSHVRLIDNYKLNRKAGIISRSIYGYSEFCKDLGYELKNYPRIFAERYAAEIAAVEAELEKRNSSLSDYYNNAKRIYGRRLTDSIADELDILRRQATVELVAWVGNIRPSQVKWRPEMDEYISMVEACLVFDEIAEKTQAIAGKELLSEQEENSEE